VKVVLNIVFRVGVTTIWPGFNEMLVH
ncbi:uncharacterized protein METZ01_LOCUS389050, partial [marine metagenome]